MQNVFIEALNAKFTNIMSRGVVRQLAVFIEPVDIFIVYFGNVADDVRQRGAVRIETTLIAFDFNAGEAVLIHRKAGDLNFR
ncbi:hypothetical protein D3C72_1178820 [compost metagenome]